ncbi:MAG: IS21 family transposase [Actinobacteria bacterium]|nr:IS21 family transposase [Actinomycetota bacterium]
MRSKVELFVEIRRGSRMEGLSVRALAKKHGVHRRMVRQALMSPQPPEQITRRWRARKIDLFVDAIDDMLRADLDAPRKQRHTTTRIFNRLIDEHDAAGLVSYSTLRTYVVSRRQKISQEAGNAPIAQVFVPQSHLPGDEAEVDFAELFVDLPQGRTKCYMFTLRLCFSGKSVHRVFATQSQEAFLEGHIEAFQALGGVPVRHVKYDNLKSAVTRVLFGQRDRVENERWILFRSHYSFEAFYCLPGIEGAHEKGGVEGEGGRFRRNHLVPVPRVASLAELNAKLAAIDEADDARRINGRLQTIGQDFAIEAPLLRPLPFEAFEPGLLLTPRVDRHARITVRNCHYSVPARFIGRKVRVRLRSNELIVLDGRTRIAHHERSTRKGAQVLDLDHYLEVLKIKPGALPGATALVQARECGSFTSAHEAFWAAARKAHGDADGTRELIEVLLLHRNMAHADVIGGLRAAITVGAISADVVAVEARKHAQDNAGSRPAAAATAPGERVTSLTARHLADPVAVIAGLPPDFRPPPSVAGYDQLLTRRRTPNPTIDPATTKGNVS